MRRPGVVPMSRRRDISLRIRNLALPHAVTTGFSRRGLLVVRLLPRPGSRRLSRARGVVAADDHGHLGHTFAVDVRGCAKALERIALAEPRPFIDVGELGESGTLETLPDP